ncbi:SCP160 protein [Russula earlei]|uniref:SCP160 protein n=1 Tax=Russula earlei TaxID=71964 RepID=A0ACC0U9E2_9AGAM|nr:SCP160 protein [Russula earlei]
MDAAALTRLHHLEGAPDPFPSEVVSAPVSRPPNLASLDTDSDEAFPSLAPSPVNVTKTVAPAWGAHVGPRLAAHSSQATESFTLSAIDLSSAGKDGKLITLGEVMKQVMVNHKIKIEASTNQKTRQTTFHLKADSRKELDKAKRSLLASLSPVVSIVVNAPASTISSIIGSKGATLKQIRDQTSVKIDIPRRDTLVLPSGNGVTNGGSPHTSGATSPVPTDDDDEPTVPITVTGPQPLAVEAHDLIKQIIASKRARATQRVRDIPLHIVPFVKARYAAFLEAAEGGVVELLLKSADREVTVSGDREAVLRVIEAVKSTILAVSASLTSVKIPLPKRQHRLLVGNAVSEILASGKCVVTVPPTEDASEEIIVWGKAEDLGTGVAAVMSRANSQYIHEFPLPGPIAVSRQLLTYIHYTGYSRTLATANPGVLVFIPEPAARSKASVLNVDLVGEKALVDAAVRQVSELMGKLNGATKEVPVDWLVHKVVQGKHAKKIRQLHESHNILFFFPPESEEQSSVLLVYDPTSPSASPSPVEKTKNVEEAEKELIKWAKDASDVKSQVVAVEKKWHKAVIGKGGTTLNAIIGEEKALSIKVGAEANEPSTEDVILVRGASAEVERAVRDILKIVEDAKNDLILSSHSVEFEIDREYVGRVVGSQGSGVNKLRESLGVKIDFSDDGDDIKDAGKKRRGAVQKSKITIVGRKENVEEAKRRIISQVERLADETSEILSIPAQYHSGLIGQNGKYVIRLEEKYNVKIIFPRGSSENAEGRSREHLKPDEVFIKGGKKGVAGAKSELLEAADFEKESNIIVKFTVPVRAIPRILGRSGATFKQIKEDTDAAIDLDKADDGSGATITCRGTKKAISAAKAAIQSIVDQVGEETTEVLTIENKFHKTLIGAGGQGVRSLIVRCGGPTDPKAQAGLVRFPRPGEEPRDEVRLRGETTLVNKLKAELEKAAADMRDRVVLGVQIPSAAHKSLIGRGGRNLTSFQNEYHVQVQYPGSNSYKHAGEPENAEALCDVPPEDLVKLSGARASVEQAIEKLKLQAANNTPPESVSDTFTVPLKYHDAVTSQGAIFRTLRHLGVDADPSAQPTRPSLPSHPLSSSTPMARVDDVDDTVTGAHWQIVENYADAEEGESTWNLKARDQASIDKAKAALTEAIVKAKAATHVGFLTLPDRSSFPRIVGAKGSNIARLHDMTGANILVGRENNTIIITGPISSLDAAREAILKTISGANRQKRVH